MEEFKRTETEFIIKLPDEIEMTEEEAFRGINIGFCYIRAQNRCSEDKL
ncbi:MAG: hypothetical protein ACFFAN_02450 [Promethearchaeota archaeon]